MFGVLTFGKLSEERHWTENEITRLRLVTVATGAGLEVVEAARAPRTQ